MNHGIGFNTAAIELLLPTYGAGTWIEGQGLHALGVESASNHDSCHRWELISSRLAESNCRVFLELGSGAQLARMALAERSTLEARSISEFRTVDGIVAWVENALERAS